MVFETGWVIEHEDCDSSTAPAVLVWDGCDWTSYHADAVRFCRAKDACKVAARFGHGKVVQYQFPKREAPDTVRGGLCREKCVHMMTENT